MRASQLMSFCMLIAMLQWPYMDGEHHQLLASV